MNFLVLNNQPGLVFQMWFTQLSLTMDLSLFHLWNQELPFLGNVLPGEAFTVFLNISSAGRRKPENSFSVSFTPGVKATVK